MSQEYACTRCGSRQEFEIVPHTCPYEEELGGDAHSDLEYCKCCDECMSQCCMDI